MGSRYLDNVGIGGQELDSTAPGFSPTLAGLLGSSAPNYTVTTSNASIRVYHVTGSIGSFTYSGDITVSGNLMPQAGQTQTVSSISGFHGEIDISGTLSRSIDPNSIFGTYPQLMGTSDTVFTSPDTSDIYNSDIVGDGGRNNLLGSFGNDFFDGGGGADVMSGDAGNDTFRLYYGNFLPGKSIDGGGGNRDTIEVKLGTNPGSTDDVDLSVGSFTNIEVLRYIELGPEQCPDRQSCHDQRCSGDRQWLRTGAGHLVRWRTGFADDQQHGLYLRHRGFLGHGLYRLFGRGGYDHIHCRP